LLTDLCSTAAAAGDDAMWTDDTGVPDIAFDRAKKRAEKLLLPEPSTCNFVFFCHKL
jgi:hypothetical protein